MLYGVESEDNGGKCVVPYMSDELLIELFGIIIIILYLAQALYAC